MTKRETHVHRFHHWWCPQRKESLQKEDEKEDRQVDIPQQERGMHFNCDKKKVGEILNEIFPLVITDIISNFVVSQVVTYGSNSCDIMYSGFLIIENGGEKKKSCDPTKDPTYKLSTEQKLILRGTLSLYSSLGRDEMPRHSILNFW